MNDLKHIGKMCADARRKNGLTQLQVAYEIGYTSENISAFECGRNDNLRIFLWYLINCVTEINYCEFIRGVNDEYKGHS